MLSDIDKLRREKSEDRQRAYRLAQNMEQMLERFNNDSSESMISFKELKSTHVGEIYYVNPKVYFIPIKITESELKFITIVEPDGSFGVQEHDVPEWCKILKGHLIEYLDNNKVYGEGDIVSYKAYKKHKPGAKFLSVYLVTFREDSVNVTPAET